MSNYIQSMRAHIGHAPLMIAGACVVIYNDKMEILLQRRTDDGTWGPHGGAVELGETVEETAKREVFEELGLVVKNLKFHKVLSGEDMHHVYPNGDEVYIVNSTFTCNEFEGEINIDPVEVSEVAWFEYDRLPENLNKSAKLILKDLESILK